MAQAITWNNIDVAIKCDLLDIQLVPVPQGML